MAPSSRRDPTRRTRRRHPSFGAYSTGSVLGRRQHCLKPRLPVPPVDSPRQKSHSVVCNSRDGLSGRECGCNAPESVTLFPVHEVLLPRECLTSKRICRTGWCDVGGPVMHFLINSIGALRVDTRRMAAACRPRFVQHIRICVCALVNVALDRRSRVRVVFGWCTCATALCRLRHARPGHRSGASRIRAWSCRFQNSDASDRHLAGPARVVHATRCAGRRLATNQIRRGAGLRRRWRSVCLASSCA